MFSLVCSRSLLVWISSSSWNDIGRIPRQFCAYPTPCALHSQKLGNIKIYDFGNFLHISVLEIGTCYRAVNRQPGHARGSWREGAPSTSNTSEISAKTSNWHNFGFRAQEHPKLDQNSSRRFRDGPWTLPDRYWMDKKISIFHENLDIFRKFSSRKWKLCCGITFWNSNGIPWNLSQKMRKGIRPCSLSLE